MKSRILFTVELPVGKEAMDILSQVGEVTFARADALVSEQRLIDELKGCDVVIQATIEPKLTKKIIESSSSLRMIAGVGPASDRTIDVDAATERGIVVTQPGRGWPTTIATLTIGLMIALTRRIVELHNVVKQGQWKKEKYAGFIGRDLIGKNLGIIGFGEIGSKVAEIAGTLDMKVLVYDPYVDTSKILKAGGKPIDLEQLLRESDVVSLHAALTKENEHIIDEKAISLMKRGAILVNTARGALVDESALCQALSNGRIAGAALDVFDEEPINRDNPLLRLENVVLTPHIGGVTIERKQTQITACAKEIHRFLTGKIPENVVNPQVLKKQNR